MNLAFGLSLKFMITFSDTEVQLNTVWGTIFRHFYMPAKYALISIILEYV